MSLLIVFFCILLLIILVSKFEINPFLGFLLISILGGMLLGIPMDKITGSVQKGIGDTLGSLTIIICTGAMLGKIVASSGAAQKIATVMVSAVGERYIQWAMVASGFIIGLPLFYGVGFVLMVPLVFSVVYRYKFPAVYVGLPMLAALSVTHGFLPPHPSPVALVVQFKANMGMTLLYGLLIAIPAIVIAGPLFSRTLKKINSQPLEVFKPVELTEEELPGAANSFVTALLPVVLLMSTTLLSLWVPQTSAYHPLIRFVSEPSVVMLIALLFATFSLGTSQGKKVPELMSLYVDAVKDIAQILLIIGGAGAFMNVLTDSGVSHEIADKLQGVDVHPLILAWFMAATIRVCIGSATVAGLTTAGIIAPIMGNTHVDPNLMVLVIGAGSLAFSHVNDSGFWLFKEYFNLSLKDTIRSWSMMESIVSVVGLLGVLLLNAVLPHL